MKIKVWLLLLLPFAFISPAQARLGETLQELQARFGYKQGSGGTLLGDGLNLDALEFQKENVSIDVELSGGHSIFERYQSKAMFSLTRADIKKLLESNSQGHKWTNQDGGRNWKRDDGATATYNGTTADFSSIEYLDMVEAHRKAQVPSVSGM